MRNEGVYIGDKLTYLCYHNPRSNKIKYDVNNRDFAPLVRDMYEGKYSIFNYPIDEGFLNNQEKELEHARIRRDTARYITNHFDNKKSCDTGYIIKYCQFFGCSADYLLGLQKRPTQRQTDIGKKTGLTDAAITTLLSSPDVQVVCNSLLATGSIQSLVGFLQIMTQHERMNNYVINHLHNELGENFYLSDDKYKAFQDSLKYAQIRLQGDMAFTAINTLCNDQTLVQYFDNKSTESLASEAKDIRNIAFWKKQLKLGLEIGNQQLVDEARSSLGLPTKML